MSEAQQSKPASREPAVAQPRASRVRVRVLIVDDHAVLRQALRLLLESHDEIDVVGMWRTGGRRCSWRRSCRRTSC